MNTIVRNVESKTCLEEEMQNGGGSSASFSVARSIVEPRLTQGGQLNGRCSLLGQTLKATLSGKV